MHEPGPPRLNRMEPAAPVRALMLGSGRGVGVRDGGWR